MRLVLDAAVRAQAHEGRALDLEDVREEIAALQREVLNDEIKCLVGVLDAWDGDICDLAGELGHDDCAEVVPELKAKFSIKRENRE